MPLTPQHIYEATLVVRSQIGDEPAFAELLKLYGPRLLLYTRNMLNTTPHRVEDVTQEIWIAIFRGLPSLRDVSKFRPWAFRVARDRIYREFRRHELPSDSIEECPDLPETHWEIAIDSEDLQRCLNSISPEHREVLVLRFFEEMNYDEIARVTGASLGTVRSRLHYGKLALRHAWEGKPT